MSDTFRSLEHVVRDPRFAEVDHRLRGGYHFDLEEVQAYEFLQAAQSLLDEFYAGYGCRLMHAGTEGYFYLLSEGALLGSHRLGLPEMVVGQMLALMRMDPAFLDSQGRVTLAQVLTSLEMLLGEERLVHLLAPRSRGRDRNTDARKVRDEVEKALRRLVRLGFASEFRDSGEFLPRRSVMRFTDPVRAKGDLQEGLRQLLMLGAVAMDEPGESDEDTEPAD